MAAQHAFRPVLLALTALLLGCRGVEARDCETDLPLDQIRLPAGFSIPRSSPWNHALNNSRVGSGNSTKANVHME